MQWCTLTYLTKILMRVLSNAHAGHIWPTGRRFLAPDLMTHSDQRTPASGLYKSLQILVVDNMIRLTLIAIAHSFHHKTLPKIFDNLFRYQKTWHSYNARIRSNQNFFKLSVNTNIGKKSIQYRGVEVWRSLKLSIKLLGSTSFPTQVKKYLLDID